MSQKYPKYTKAVKLDTIYRGDTFDGFRLKISEGGTPVVPLHARCHLKTTRGSKVADLDPRIDGDYVVVDPVMDTADWKTGTLVFDVELTFDDRVRTFITGSFEVVEDITV